MPRRHVSLDQRSSKIADFYVCSSTAVCGGKGRFETVFCFLVDKFLFCVSFTPKCTKRVNVFYMAGIMARSSNTFGFIRPWTLNTFLE